MQQRTSRVLTSGRCEIAGARFCDVTGGIEARGANIVRMRFQPCPQGAILDARKTSLVAVYPGSFDPITNGHLDLIARGGKMFDVLIVAVLRNAEKAPLFTVAERVEMLREVTRQWPGVEIDV